jgi:hypothetical protein
LDRSSTAATTSSSLASALLVLLKRSPLYLLIRRACSELILTDGYSAVTIFCRHGGVISTSSGEALIRSGHGCSNPFLHEVIRSPWRKGGLWLQIIAERGLPGS